MTLYRIWPATSGPGSSDADSPVNLGTLVRLSVEMWVVQIHYWRADVAQVVSDAGAVWAVGGGGTPISGTTVVSFSGSPGGWQDATVSPAVHLAAGDYVVGGHHPSGYSATANFFDGNPVTNGPITAPDDTEVNGRFLYSGSLAEPVNNGGGASYWWDITLSDVDPGGSTLPLGTAGETDAAVALGAVKLDTLGVAVEADAARALTAAKTRVLGVAVEADAAVALAGGKTRVLGTAAETDTALPLARLHTPVLGVAGETDTARPLAASKTRVLGVAVETDTAVPLGLSHLVALGVAAELDTARALAGGKTKTLGVAVELDTARALSSGASAGLRIRLSGREPARSLSGREPGRTLSGREDVS